MRRNNEILTKGAGLYVDALSAVRTFEEQVFAAIEVVYRSRRQEIAKAMRRQLPPLFKRRSNPESAAKPWTSIDLAWLGVKSPLQGGEGVILGVEWWPSDDGLRVEPWACISFWAHPPEISAIVDQLEMKFGEDRVCRCRTGVDFYSSSPVEPFGDLEKHLSNLCTEWIRFHNRSIRRRVASRRS